jgi:hypothetical protein
LRQTSYILQEEQANFRIGTLQNTFIGDIRADLCLVNIELSKFFQASYNDSKNIVI